MIELEVKFTKRLYGTPDGDYSVFTAELVNFEDSGKVKENKRYGNFTISGNFSLEDNEIGSVFTVTIEEDIKARYPNSYKLIKLHYEFPTDPGAQWDYLENSNLLPIGTFMNVKKTFKMSDKILDIITDNPDELQKVPGIGEERSKLYQRKLLENKDKALLFAEYGDIDGVGSLLINKLVTMRPSVEDTIESIKEDPFVLIQEVDVGFTVADKFREHYDFPLNDKNRILHGVSYYLNEGFQSTGNTYEDVLVASRNVSQKLLVSYQEVVTLLAEIQHDEKAFKKYRLKIFGKNITTDSLYESELTIYKKMEYMSTSTKKIIPDDEWAKNKEEHLSTLSETLSEKQDAFLDAINNNQVSILLGPGGAGKSWVINIACELIMKAKKTFGLFAPTARAAHVMAEYVGVEAKTIHRGLMQYAMAAEAAPFDVIIIDEFSMVDSELAHVVLKSMNKNTRLIIVGDPDQLQSVGPGNVLFDIVNYIGVPTTQLTEIFRQKEGSKLLDYAQDLRDGTFKLPVGAPKIDEGDIVFIQEDKDTTKQEIAMKLYSDALGPTNGDYKDVMLLSPINKGAAGRSILNKRVQSIVNPGGSPSDVIFGGRLKDEDSKRYFRKGDFITVSKNVYDMVSDADDLTSIINGDLGEVSRTATNRLTFDINKNSYTIDKSEITELIDHAWTITIHKSQGGQAGDVIIVLPENSYFMLNANMLYTAITRARKRCYVIGDFERINEAAKRKANYARKTMIQLQSQNLNKSE